jgi:hypothetical protein
MGFLNQKTKVEITPISGVIRVTIASDPNFVGAAVEMASMAVFFWLGARSFLNLPRIWQGVVAFAVASAVAGIFQSIQHSEALIEFGKEKVRIGRVVMGLERMSEYAVEKCSELTWCEPRDTEDGSVLEFKYGLRKIRCGAGLSAQQGQEILAALQEHLPEVAQKMGMFSGSETPHFTRLGLG